MTSSPNLAADFRAALRPLASRLKADRTLSTGKAGILERLQSHGPCTASELAAAEHITPQAIANAMQELENLGLVVRVRDTADRRKIRVELTNEGAAALERERQAGTSWLAGALAERLDDSERAILAAAIPVLHKLLGDLDD